MNNLECALERELAAADELGLTLAEYRRRLLGANPYRLPYDKRPHAHVRGGGQGVQYQRDDIPLSGEA